MMAETKPITSTPPSLVGHKLYLRPATPDDIAKSYHWITLTDPQKHSWRPEPILSAAEAAEQYKARKNSDTEQTFMVVPKKDGPPVALIKYENFNPLNRSAEIMLYIDPDEEKAGHDQEALKILLGFLFSSRDLNKVIAIASELKADWVAQLEEVGFKKEGTLRQHHYYEGGLHDVHLYSLLAFEYRN